MINIKIKNSKTNQIYVKKELFISYLEKKIMGSVREFNLFIDEIFTLFFKLNSYIYNYLFDKVYVQKR